MAAPAKKTRAEARRKGPGTDGKQDGQEGKIPKETGGKGHTEKKGKGVKKPSRQELGRQVSQELLKLRPIIKDIGTALLDRVDGELAGLAQALDGGGLPDETRVLPPAPLLSAMLADIKALKVKSKKGRIKDLRRVVTLLDSLHGQMPPEA